MHEFVTFSAYNQVTRAKVIVSEVISDTVLLWLRPRYWWLHLHRESTHRRGLTRREWRRRWWISLDLSGLCFFLASMRPSNSQVRLTGNSSPKKIKIKSVNGQSEFLTNYLDQFCEPNELFHWKDLICLQINAASSLMNSQQDSKEKWEDILYYIIYCIIFIFYNQNLFRLK